MSKIIVTGASGFLGKELISMLKERNLDFVGVVRNLKFIEEINSSENYIYCDLSITTDVLKMLKKVKPDIIINLAAFVDFQEKNIKNFFPVNVLLPAILGNYCKQKNLLLVHSSSTIVHGFSHELYNINTDLSPDTSYGKSKLLADDLIIASGCEASILRIGGIYGLNGPPHLGINKAIDVAKKRQLPTIIGSGDAKRNYIYVKDVAQAIVKCIEERITGIYYLGGEIKTIKAMLDDICDVFIPGQQPKHIKGECSKDQIIENSDRFSITPFRKVLEKIK